MSEGKFYLRPIKTDEPIKWRFIQTDRPCPGDLPWNMHTVDFLMGQYCKEANISESDQFYYPPIKLALPEE